MASPHLAALSLDSPLHVSTPAQAHTTSLSKGHLGHNCKKPVLFQQLLSTSCNDEAEKNLFDNGSSSDQPKLTSCLKKCRNSASHSSAKQPERFGGNSVIKQGSQHLDDDSFEEKTVWGDRCNGSTDVYRQTGKPATCRYSQNLYTIQLLLKFTPMHMCLLHMCADYVSLI